VPNTPSISRDTLESKISSTPFSGQDIRALLRNDPWNDLESLNAQLVFLGEFASIECAHPLDIGHLADVFNLIRDRIRKVLTKSKKTGKAPHRPLPLTLKQE
jgi:hypothetical protein